MATEGTATILQFPDRRPEFAASTLASLPEVGDVLTRARDEWLVVEVIESIDGKYALTLEPMERATSTRADGGSRGEPT
jgi:hypothetical protein